MIKKKPSTDTELTLTTLREAAGLTQESLARKLDCSSRIVGDWDNRRSYPRIDRAAELAKALGVSLKTLYRAFGIDISSIPDDCCDERRIDKS
jgi:transcriptional regulator with XRE-family HTH domain